jgi:hypothetical protein
MQDRVATHRALILGKALAAVVEGPLKPGSLSGLEALLQQQIMP